MFWFTTVITKNKIIAILEVDNEATIAILKCKLISLFADNTLCMANVIIATR